MYNSISMTEAIGYTKKCGNIGILYTPNYHGTKSGSTSNTVSVISLKCTAPARVNSLSKQPVRASEHSDSDCAKEI